jgi:hypothetical protein
MAPLPTLDRRSNHRLLRRRHTLRRKRRQPIGTHYDPDKDISLKERKTRKWLETIKDGERGEALFEYLLSLGIDTIEIKNDQQGQDTGNIFVETQCFKGDREYISTGGKSGDPPKWRPSGINETKAELWVFIFHEDPPNALILPTEYIREMVQDKREIDAPGTKPKAKGKLISIPQAIIAARILNRNGRLP